MLLRTVWCSQRFGLSSCSVVGLDCAMAAKTTKAQFRGEAFEKGLDIAEIHQKWDADSEIRNRLRGGAMSLLHPKSGLTCDNSTCSLNKGLLTPILMGMSANPDRKLPGLNDLRHEMACCFRANNRVGKEVMEAVAGDATHLRKLLSHVKSKARRHEVSLEARPNNKRFASFSKPYNTSTHTSPINSPFTP